MDSEIFQKIYDALEDFLPVKWSKVIFRADYTEGSYGMKYYAAGDDGKFIDCYSLPNVSSTQIIKAFIEINKVLSPSRTRLPEKDRWSVLTMTINADGSFKTDFDYTDISESSMTYMEEWEKKYLQ